jgi:Tol biopolymer transport system component
VNGAARYIALILVVLGSNGGTAVASSPPHGGSSVASVTPPGRIVYSGPLERGGHGIFVASADGSRAAPITSGPEDISPRWSPDGMRIAFTRRAGDDASEIWVVNADGTDARPLDAEHRYAEHPRWSPGGGWIAYQVQTSTHVRSGTRAHTTYDLWLVRPDGSGRRRLVRDDGDVVNANPVYHVAMGAWAWSPDGRSIAYVCCDELGGIRIVDVATGRDRGRGPGHDVAWAPDGRRLAVTVDAEHEIAGPECGGIWIVSRESGKRRRLVRPPGGACDRWARWSPDGRSIVLARSAPESSRDRLLMATSAGRGLRAVKPLDPTRHTWPSRCVRLFEYGGGGVSGWVVRAGPTGAPRFVRLPVASKANCDPDDTSPCALAGDWRC